MAAKGKNDWGLKIVSVVAALVLWLYASAEVNPIMEKNFDVSVEYLNQGEDMLILDEKKRITITVKGRQNDLLTLRNDDFWAGVDLTGAEKGTKEYPLEIRVPDGIERYTTSASTVKLHLEKWETKTVPIKLETTGELASSYQLVKSAVIPSTLQISGYSHLLAEIEEIDTQAVDLSTINDNYSQDIPLILPEGVTVAHNQVQVQLDVIEVERQREFELPVDIRNLGDGMTATIEHSRATCLLKGTDRQFAAFHVEQIQLYVDCTDLTVGNHLLPIQMENNSTFSMVELTPVELEVVISPKSFAGSYEISNEIQEVNE